MSSHVSFSCVFGAAPANAKTLFAEQAVGFCGLKLSLLAEYRLCRATNDPPTLFYK